MVETIKEVIKTLWAICRLRKGPEDLPNSPIVFAVITVIAVLFLNAFNVLVSLLYVWLILKYKKYDNRFVQTTSALFGTSLILFLIMLPFQLLLFAFIGHVDMTLHHSGGFPFGLLFAIILGLVFVGWTWTVFAHVYSHALATSFLYGLLIALGGAVFAVLVQMLIGSLFAVGAVGFSSILFGANKLLYSQFMFGH